MRSDKLNKMQKATVSLTKTSIKSFECLGYERDNFVGHRRVARNSLRDMFGSNYSIEAVSLLRKLLKRNTF